MGDPNDEAEAEKYAALAQEMEEADDEDGRDPQQYTPSVRPDPEPPPQQWQSPEQQRQDHHQGGHQIPDVWEDPIEHFSSRMNALEERSTISQFADTARVADVEGRREYSEDYDDMVHHLNRAAIAEAERMVGRRISQAEAGQFLQGATMGVMAEAARHGVPVADYIRALAVTNGYQPRQAFGRQEYRNLVAAAEKAGKAGDDESFDKLWKIYERGVRRAERRRR